MVKPLNQDMKRQFYLFLGNKITKEGDYERIPI